MSNIQSSFVKRTREAKMNAAIAAIASKLAKQNNDILWQKSNRSKRLFIASKNAIIKKYGPQARVEWMKASNNAAKIESKDK